MAKARIVKCRFMLMVHKYLLNDPWIGRESFGGPPERRSLARLGFRETNRDAAESNETDRNRFVGRSDRAG